MRQWPLQSRSALPTRKPTALAWHIAWHQPIELRMSMVTQWESQYPYCTTENSKLHILSGTLQCTCLRGPFTMIIGGALKHGLGILAQHPLLKRWPRPLQQVVGRGEFARPSHACNPLTKGLITSKELTTASQSCGKGHESRSLRAALALHIMLP